MAGGLFILGVSAGVIVFRCPGPIWIDRGDHAPLKSGVTVPVVGSGGHVVDVFGDGSVGITWLSAPSRLGLTGRRVAVGSVVTVLRSTIRLLGGRRLCSLA